MTDKAEERIWAWEYKGHTPWGPIEPDLDVVTNGAEYIRADIHQAVEEALRLVRAQSLEKFNEVLALEAERDKLKEALVEYMKHNTWLTDHDQSDRYKLALAALGETNNE